MFKYDVKSKKAEEFINHEEILETLKFAEENKNNIPLIEKYLEKARWKYYWGSVLGMAFVRA